MLPRLTVECYFHNLSASHLLAVLCLLRMLQVQNSPIIVGERYELAEALSHGGDNDGGLLARSEYQAALLSMSEFDRHAAAKMNGR